MTTEKGTVLLTGATGFIGRHVLTLLEAAGYEVHACRRPQRAGRPRAATPYGIGTEGGAGSTRWHEIDLLDPNAIERLVIAADATHLVHLAWDLAPGVYAGSETNEVWTDASLRLVDAFIRQGGEYLLITGTGAEYGGSQGLCHEETTACAPRSAYAKAKHRLYRAANDLCGHNRVPLSWVRLFNLYGPGERSERLVPSVACALLAGREARCTDGTHARDFLHVEDAADGIVATLGERLAGPVNVASGRAVTIRRVVNTIASYAGRPDLIRLGALSTPEGEPPRLVADIGRMKAATTWRPRIGLEAGLASTYEWWVERSLLA